MSALAMRVNVDPALAQIPIDDTELRTVVGGVPVLATPAAVPAVAVAVVKVAGGIAAIAGVAALGYAIGRNFGGPNPPTDPL